MATTFVDSRIANKKTTLYVGGLDPEVTVAIVQAAFVPFGDIKDISLPFDHASGHHRGFAFIEYESPEDAADAVDNMHNSEIYGRVLKVNYAQPSKIKGGDKGFASQAVWADVDDWVERQEAEAALEDLESKQQKKKREEELRQQLPDAMQALEQQVMEGE